MSLFTRHESYLGVDIGAGGMKLVELRKTKSRPQLWTYGILDRPLDIHPPEEGEKTVEALLEEKEGSSVPGKKKKHADDTLLSIDDSRIAVYAEMLKNLAHRARVTTNRATASLPVSHVFHAVMTLPPVEEKELAHHVEAKVKKMLPRPIEEMQVVHQKVPPKTPEEKDLTILVTAAPKRLVAFYTAIFQKAGLALEELETEAFAIERSLVGRDTATVMVVDIGAERTNFFIIDAGLPITHRSIQAGAGAFDAIMEKELQIPRELLNQVRVDASHLDGANVPIEPFLPVLDSIVKEIQYNFDIFLHQSRNEGKRPEKIILTGGLSLFPPVQEYLRQEFQMKVFVGDPWARVVYQDGLRRVLDPIAPRMAVAIGLALRNIV